MSTRGRIAGIAVRAGGFLLGLSVVAVAIWSWRVPGGNISPGAELILQAQPLGELEIAPLEPLPIGRSLTPGGRSGTAALDVRNQTGATLDVSLRATPAQGELDGMVMIEVRTDKARIFRGRLGALRRWTPDGFELPPGTASELLVSAWLPAGSGSGFEGRTDTLSLELRPVAVGS